MIDIQDATIFSSHRYRGRDYSVLFHSGRVTRVGNNFSKTSVHGGGGQITSGAKIEPVTSFSSTHRNIWILLDNGEEFAINIPGENVIFRKGDRVRRFVASHKQRAAPFTLMNDRSGKAYDIKSRDLNDDINLVSSILQCNRFYLFFFWLFSSYAFIKVLGVPPWPGMFAGAIGAAVFGLSLPDGEEHLFTFASEFRQKLEEDAKNPPEPEAGSRDWIEA